MNTIDDIIYRISLYMPSLAIKREEVVQFAMEAIRYMGLVHTMTLKTEYMDVVDQQICLPDNAVRVLRISRDCPGCEPYRSVQEGRYIRFRGECPQSPVIVKYYAYQTDSKNEPIIGDDLEDVIFYWILWAKLFEPYMNGKLPSEQFNFITKQLSSAKRMARGSFRTFTMTEAEELIALIRSPYIPVRDTE